VSAFLGVGVLLLAWPSRAERHGGFPYSPAIVVTAACALLAASVYAYGSGIRAAQTLVRTLPEHTAVIVYSIQPLALSGPGVTVVHLPARFLYHYRYQGLRLLMNRSGTYYILPVAWDPLHDITYIIDSSEQIRIELSGSALPR
jgi:hypothetical protein